MENLLNSKITSVTTYKIAILIIVGCCLNISGLAQKKFDSYAPEGQDYVLTSGDTLYFQSGSLGGQFVHVFSLFGKTPPVRAPFQGANSALIIDHFRIKKDDGIEKTYAVSKIPNVKNVLVYTEVDKALMVDEIKINK